MAPSGSGSPALGLNSTLSRLVSFSSKPPTLQTPSFVIASSAASSSGVADQANSWSTAVASAPRDRPRLPARADAVTALADGRALAAPPALARRPPADAADAARPAALP